MRLYMLELPRMQKAIKEQNNLDEWCYMFRNFPKFVGIPEEVNPRFHKLMETIRISNMTDEQKKDYFKSSIDDDEREDIAQANFEYGKEEGRAEGRVEGATQTSREIAAKMKAKRIPPTEIAEITGLSEEEIAVL